MRSYYNHSSQLVEIFKQIRKLKETGSITRGAHNVEQMSDTTASLYVGHLVVPEGCLILDEQLETHDMTKTSKTYEKFFVADHYSFATAEQLKRSLTKPEPSDKRPVSNAPVLTGIFFGENEKLYLVSIGHMYEGKGIFSVAYFTGPVI